MTFTTDLDSLHDLAAPTAFGFAKKIIAPEWIEAALEATGTRSIRRRKLPADSVMWLVMAMALFRDNEKGQAVAFK